MINPFKIGDKIKLSKRQLDNETNFLRNNLLNLCSLSYETIYTVISIVSNLDIEIEVHGYKRSFYARFFELSNMKTIGFVIDDD